MVQLYVDLLTNKITGYNYVIPSPIPKDVILVKEKEFSKLSNFISKDYYYIDGEIIEKNFEEDQSTFQKEKIDSKVNDLQTKVNNEHKIFMDNIINGMSIETATQISKSNREALKEALDEQNALEKMREEAVKQAQENKIQQEEMNLDYKYFLSMVAVIRDENPYLEEWIRYHIEEMGFEHFYLYDNESIIPAKDYLTEKNFKYLDNITFIDWKTSQNTQQDSHNDFLQKYANETKWILPADPDEYVKLNDGSKSLKVFLEENSDYATVGCPWVCFNANGHVEKTDEPDMVRFTQETEWNYGKNKGKYFAQSNRINYFRNYVPIPRFELPTRNINDEESGKFYQLNHYYTRSLEEWKEKIERGTCLPYFSRKFSEFFELNPDMVGFYDGNDFKQEYCPVRNNNDTIINNE